MSAATNANPYPYAGPPPPHPAYYNQANPNAYYNQANPNAYYNPHQPVYAPPRPTFFSRLVTAFIVILFIFASILFIVWLVLRPRVPEFRLNSLSVSHLNATSSPTVQIFGNWSAQFTALNPNTKMHAHYEVIEGYVFYESELLAQNRLPPFDQGTKAETNLTATMVAAQAYVYDWVVTGINEDKKHGSLKFNVRIAAVVHFQSSGWRTRRRVLRVLCEDAPVRMSSDGASGMLSGDPQSCLLFSSKWIVLRHRRRNQRTILTKDTIEPPQAIGGIFLKMCIFSSDQLCDSYNIWKCM